VFGFGFVVMPMLVRDDFRRVGHVPLVRHGLIIAAVVNADSPSSL